MSMTCVALFLLVKSTGWSGREPGTMEVEAVFGMRTDQPRGALRGSTFYRWLFAAVHILGVSAPIFKHDRLPDGLAIAGPRALARYDFSPPCHAAAGVAEGLRFPCTECRLGRCCHFLPVVLSEITPNL